MMYLNEVHVEGIDINLTVWIGRPVCVGNYAL